MSESTFVVAFRAMLDQKRPYIMNFVRNNGLENLNKLAANFAERSESSDPDEVLISILALYGLMTAILEYEESHANASGLHDDCGMNLDGDPGDE